MLNVIKERVNIFATKAAVLKSRVVLGSVMVAMALLSGVVLHQLVYLSELSKTPLSFVDRVMVKFGMMDVIQIDTTWHLTVFVCLIAGMTLLFYKLFSSPVKQAKTVKPKTKAKKKAPAAKKKVALETEG